MSCQDEKTLSAEISKIYFERKSPWKTNGNQGVKGKLISEGVLGPCKFKFESIKIKFRKN